MFLDAHLSLSDAQALTATAASTNYYDAGAARAIGDGEPLAALVTIDVAADFASSNETYVITVESDDNTSFSSATTLASRTMTAAERAAGSRIIIPIPPSTPAERYYRLNYTLAGTTPTVTLTAQIQPMSMLQNERVYAGGFTIS